MNNSKDLVRPRRVQRAGVLLATATVLVAALATPVAAAPRQAPARADEDTFSWTIVPSSPSGPKDRRQFDYELNPKESIVDWFSVGNLGAKPLAVDLYATDAFTTSDGGFALLDKDQPATDVGTWITLPKKSTTLAAGKRADMSFTLKVPPTASPGDHVGGIIAAVTQEVVNEKGQRVNVERRIAARVYLRVAGPLHPAASITRVDVDYDTPIVPLPGGKMQVTYRVANNGNVRLSGKVRVRVTGPLGVRVASSDLVDIPELLPDSEIRLRQQFASVFPAGELTASVEVNPQSDRDVLPSLAAKKSVTAIPWLILALILLIAAAVAYRLFLLRARRRGSVVFDDADAGGEYGAGAGRPAPAAGTAP